MLPLEDELGKSTHGMSKTKIYGTWRGMLNRCKNPKCSDYYRFGGCGISVCDEWMDLTTFVEWATNNGYADGMGLMRLDIDGNYCPSNCAWVSPEQRYVTRALSRGVPEITINKTVDWHRFVKKSLYGED